MEIAREIRWVYSMGYSIIEISLIMSIRTGTIRDIIKNKIWKEDETS